MNKYKKKKSRLLFIIPLMIVLVIGLTLLKRDTIKSWFNEESKNAQQKQTPDVDSPKVNVVNLEPSTPSDNQQINDQKNNADKTTDKQINSNLAATITNTRVVNSLAQVSVLINGTTNGSCLLTLIKSGSADIDKTVSIIVRNGITTCEDFNIPITSLTNGTWAVKVVLEFGQTKSNPAEGTLQVGS